MNIQFSPSKFLMVLAVSALVSCVSEPKQVVGQSPQPESSVPEIKVHRNLAALGTGCEGAAELSPADRISIVNEAVISAEKEITSNPNVFNDNESRARVGLFAAGTMSDSVPFVSIDRECWASFYEAQNALLAGKDDDAATASREWQICLRANYPTRLAIAQPYFSCFAKPTAKSGK